MILQRVLRPQGGLRAVSSRLASLRTPIHARRIHNVPQLVHGNTFEREGVPDCLSPEGYEMAWTQYQAHLVDKLNMLTEGTADENVNTGSLLVKYSRHANMATLFNYASMAHNNHFFFNCISPTSVPVPDTLERAINDSCSSVDSLRADFLATANAMFGPGFVWLVKSYQHRSLHILTTYLAGSPYPAAHFRRQPVDMATHTYGPDGERYPNSSAPVGKFGSYSASSNSDLAPGGADTQPILCVNTWPQVWLRDWGVAGKEGFLEAWWDKINWEAVAENFSQIGHERTTPAQGPRAQLFRL